MSKPKSLYAARTEAIFAEEQELKKSEPKIDKLQRCKCLQVPGINRDIAAQVYRCVACGKVIYTQEEVEDAPSLTELRNKLLERARRVR